MVAAVAATLLIRNSGRETVWALQEGLPAVHRLIDQDDHLQAHELLRQVEKVLGADHFQVRKAWEESSGTLEVTTDPAGARVGFQRYEDFDGPWRPLGETPIRDDRFPRGVFRFRIEKPGYATVEVPYNVALSAYVRAMTDLPGTSWTGDPSNRLDFRLTAAGELPENTVAVEGGIVTTVSLTGFGYDNPPKIPRFFIDRTEVTNRAFREFVAAGAYERRELWPQRFEIAGREVSWEKARSAFVDTTGSPGAGRLGARRIPGRNGGGTRFRRELVRGHGLLFVSRQAAADSLPLGSRRLPEHGGRRPAEPGDGAVEQLLPEGCGCGRRSSSHQCGRRPRHGRQRRGVDVECGRTGAVPARRLVGRSRLCDQQPQQPASGDSAQNQRPPLRALRGQPRDRRISQPIDFPVADFENVPSMSDEAFEQTRRFHAYHRSPLAAEPKSSETLSWGAREEWVTIDAAYPGERIPIRLRLPSEGSPPYQVVVVLHGLESHYATRW